MNRSSRLASGESNAITWRKDEEPFSTETPWRRVSCGRRGSTCLTRLLTLSAAVSTFAPISKVTWISTVPLDVEVELMYSMFSTPLIWFSRGAATVCSSTWAEAPGYTARTVTTGGAISGYCAIGSTRMPASPAITMKIESTAAKIGRSMKKRDIMAASRSLVVGGLRRDIFGRLAAAFIAWLSWRAWLSSRARLFCRTRFSGRAWRPFTFDRSGGIRHLDRSSRPELHYAVHDDPVARLEAVVDEPTLVGPVADLYRTLLRLVLGANDIDEFALWPLEHRALRYHGRVRTHRPVQHDASELPGAEQIARV